MAQAQLQNVRGLRMEEAEYLSKRALQELRAAIGSSDHRVRARHLEMADAYSSRLAAGRDLQRNPETEHFDAVIMRAKASSFYGQGSRSALSIDPGG